MLPHTSTFKALRLPWWSTGLYNIHWESGGIFIINWERPGLFPKYSSLAFILFLWNSIRTQDYHNVANRFYAYWQITHYSFPIGAAVSDFLYVVGLPTLKGACLFMIIGAKFSVQKNYRVTENFSTKFRKQRSDSQIFQGVEMSCTDLYHKCFMVFALAINQLWIKLHPLKYIQYESYNT